MPEHNPGQMGGTMRLGKRRTIFKSNNSVMSTCPEINGGLLTFFFFLAIVILTSDISSVQRNCTEAMNMLKRGTDTDLRYR